MLLAEVLGKDGAGVDASVACVPTLAVDLVFVLATFAPPPPPPLLLPPLPTFAPFVPLAAARRVVLAAVSLLTGANMLFGSLRCDRIRR